MRRAYFSKIFDEVVTVIALRCVFVPKGQEVLLPTLLTRRYRGVSAFLNF